MWVDFIEIFFSIGLFINALLFLPQIIKLYKQKNSQDISLLTFLGFSIIQFFTAYHGYIVKDYKLMYGFILSFALCSIVNILIIYYRLRK